MIKIALLCTSLKPAPGEWWNSAAREYLKIVEEAVNIGGGSTWLFDLRQNSDVLNYNLTENRSEFVKSLHECDGIVLSLPCYWGSLSAPALRVLDIIRNELRLEVPLGALFLGMDAPSAMAGEKQTVRILKSLRFLSTFSVNVSNPRDIASLNQAKNIRKSIQRLSAAVVVTAKSVQNSLVEIQATEYSHG